jgi:hypothetical protein
MAIDTAKIREELSTLPEHFIVLLLTDYLNYGEVVDFILKYLIQEKNADGIYLTVNKTAKSVFESIQLLGMDPKKILFIDCASGRVRKFHETQENIIVIKSPEHLTDIAVALSEMVKKGSNANRFLLVDSISTLLLFNSVKSVVKFSHFFTNLIREYRLKGLIFAVDKETDEYVKRTLYVFSDKVINA